MTTHEARTNAVRLRDKGLTLAHIGRRIGYSESGVCRLLKASGKPTRPLAKRLTTENAEAAVALRRNGLTIQQVADRLDCTWDQVFLATRKVLGARPYHKGRKHPAPGKLRRISDHLACGWDFAVGGKDQTVVGICSAMESEIWAIVNPETQEELDARVNAYMAEKGFKHRFARVSLGHPR